jgi:hypothetical protein
MIESGEFPESSSRANRYLQRISNVCRRAYKCGANPEESELRMDGIWRDTYVAAG